MKTARRMVSLLFFMMVIGLFQTIANATEKPDVTWLDKDYFLVHNFREGMAAVKLNNKWGFIDSTGKEIVPLKYDDVNSFSDGMASVRIGEKWGFIDKTGNEVIPLRYGNSHAGDHPYYFNDGLANVGEINGPNIFCLKFGFIDKTGNVVIPLKYDKVYPFKEGLAAVGMLNNQRTSHIWGFIDKTGKEVIPIKYKYVSSFNEGLAVVRINDKSGFIDKTGKMVIPAEYDGADSFSEGLAKVHQNGKAGFIDKTGKLVIPFMYDSGNEFSNGIAKVGIFEGYYGSGDITTPRYKYLYLDRTGKEVTSLKNYSISQEFSEGLVEAGKYVGADKKYGYVDTNGNEIIPFEYDYVDRFSEGLGFVKKDGKRGIIKNPLNPQA